MQCPYCMQEVAVGAFCGHCGRSQRTATQVVTAPPSLASGRYRLVHLIGEGTRKRVYLARDTRRACDVALGILKADALGPQGLVRLQCEAEASRRLGEHPHIVPVYDVGVDGDLAYLAAEHMPGGDLNDELQRAEHHRLPATRILQIADHLASALQYAHGLGIVHRDVKPANIWLAEDGGVKLGDFGLAVGPDGDPAKPGRGILGTAAYMPPEQALGRPPDPRGDLYSLGATLYQAATGRPPFEGSDAATVLSQHIHTAPVPPSQFNPDVPAALDHLILRLLAKQPEDRPDSAAAVREDVLAIASGETGVPREDRDRLEALGVHPFVGRRQEMAQLKRAVGDLARGRNQIFLLSGEAGIGKTRIMQELAAHAKRCGARVLIGRCYEGEGAPAYWPWVQIVRQYTEERDTEALLVEMGAGAPVIAQVVTEVADRLPDVGAPPALDPDQARFRFFDSMSKFLRRASQSQPLVLMLDDLHWAEKSSLLLLEFLARETAEAALLILASYRRFEVGPGHPLAEVLARLPRSDRCEPILLRGLKEADVRELISDLAGHPVSDAFVAKIYGETEGNPFFVMELLRHLAEEGIIFQEEDRWKTHVPLSQLRIPEGVREVIGRRLARLTPASREMLTVASVLGREFGARELERIIDQGPGALLEALEESRRAQVIEPLPASAGGYRFSHALIRETLYEELGADDRSQLHRRAGEVIEKLYAASLDAHLPQLAHHFLEAAPNGDLQKASYYAARAGDQAAELLAYEQAAGHYQGALRALEAARTPETLEHAGLLLSLGQAQMRAGDTAPARESLLRAALIAERETAPDLLARAAVSVGEMSFVKLWVTAVPDQALVALLEKALRMLGPEDSALRALVLGHLSMVLYFVPDHKRRAELSQAAVEMARRVGDPATLAKTLQTRQWALWAPANVEERLALASEILEIARQLRNRELALRAHQFRIVCLFELGQLERVDRELDAYSALVEETRQPLHLWYRTRFQSTRALLDGRLEDAEQLASAALSIGQPIEPENAIQSFGVQKATVLRERGRIGQMEGAFKSFTDRFPGIPAWRCALSTIYVYMDRRDEVREIVEDLSASGFHAIPQDASWLAALASLSEACSYLRDACAASHVYDLLLPYADRFVTVGNATTCYGSAHRYLGLLATTMRRWEDAERHFRAATEAHERSKARLWLAHTWFARARMHAERAEPGDHEAALELTNRALDAAHTMRMSMLVEWALALKLRLQGSAATPVQSSIDMIAGALEHTQLDLRTHAAPDGTVTLLCSDMENFTATTQRLGDRAALALIHRHHQYVREQVSAHRGYEVELKGDGFMVAFPSARQALLCALDIQRVFALHCAEHPDEPMRVRIGVHTGEVIKDLGHFFGKTVILASRIADQAQGGEILVSPIVRELTEGMGDLRFGGPREASLKGLPGTYALFSVTV